MNQQVIDTFNYDHLMNECSVFVDEEVLKDSNPDHRIRSANDGSRKWR